MYGAGISGEPCAWLCRMVKSHCVTGDNFYVLGCVAVSLMIVCRVSTILRHLGRTMNPGERGPNIVGKDTLLDPPQAVRVGLPFLKRLDGQ